PQPGPPVMAQPFAAGQTLKAPQHSPSYAAQTTPIERRSGTGLILAAGLLGALVIIAGIGDFAFIRPGNPPASPQQSKSEGTEQGKSDLSPADSLTATEHYESGKKHQDQANMLANGGSKAESTEESQKAIAECRQSLALQPSHPEAHENL